MSVQTISDSSTAAVNLPAASSDKAGTQSNNQIVKFDSRKWELGTRYAAIALSIVTLVAAVALVVFSAGLVVVPSLVISAVLIGSAAAALVTLALIIANRFVQAKLNKEYKAQADQREADLKKANSDFDQFKLTLESGQVRDTQSLVQKEAELKQANEARESQKEEIQKLNAKITELNETIANSTEAKTLQAKQQELNGVAANLKQATKDLEEKNSEIVKLKNQITKISEEKNQEIDSLRTKNYKISEEKKEKEIEFQNYKRDEAERLTRATKDLETKSSAEKKNADAIIAKLTEENKQLAQENRKFTQPADDRQEELENDNVIEKTSD